MEYKKLKKQHKKLHHMLKRETERQSDTINLIASENYVSGAVLEALATPFTNKYAEGFPGKRYYFGNEVVDHMERSVQKLALKAFRLSPEKWSVNVQPYSGSTANLAVYMALIPRGGTILSMDLAHGGHLTHGSPVSMTGKTWNFVHYGVGKDGKIDYAEVKRISRAKKPKLIVCGATAYPRIIDFKRFASITENIGAILLADISHIGGLVVGGAHPSPFPYADVITTTTQKTLRGPRGAMVFSRSVVNSQLLNVPGKIDKAIFPGLQGGPHENQIFAVGVALEEALKPNFRVYARQVIKNAKAFAFELKKLGFTLISRGTDNHLVLIDVTLLGWTGQTAGEALEKAGIVVNKNMVPYDKRSPRDPSGIRIGTPAITTLGMREKEMYTIATMIFDVLIRKVPASIVKKKVVGLMKNAKIKH